MKKIILLLLTLNVFATPIQTDHNGDGVVGINDLSHVAAGIPTTGMNETQRKTVMDTQIKGEADGQGEEVQSESLNMKFQALQEEINTLK